jgi:hypothetical protein
MGQLQQRTYLVVMFFLGTGTNLFAFTYLSTSGQTRCGWRTSSGEIYQFPRDRIIF